MVEIGGSFRIPDIVLESGCGLIEVGCTNKTKLQDYANKLKEHQAIILQCHPSNFKIIGFTESPSTTELAELAHNQNSILIDDLGHGCLVDTTQFGLPKERTIQDSISDGADIVLASGDKLLGGPQAGLILGKAHLIEQISKHPLARALRVDKLTLSFLYETLKAYAEHDIMRIPVWKYASKPLAEVEKSAIALANAFPGEAVVSKGFTQMGGGAMPESGIETFRAGLISTSPDQLSIQLRHMEVPLIGRIEDSKLWLDPRTADDSEVLIAVRQLEDMKLHG